MGLWEGGLARTQLCPHREKGQGEADTHAGESLHSRGAQEVWSLATAVTELLEWLLPPITT